MQRAWWREFFESEDSIPLSFFPTPEETEREVEGLTGLLELKPGQLIADICCGMGRHALPLAEAGFEVVGVDASEMMLAAAKDASGGQSGFSANDAKKGTVPRALRLLAVRADAANLPLRSASVDVALNLFNSFGYFEDEGADQRVLDETARCLRAGGKFLLETRNREHQILFAPHHLRVALADGSPAAMRCHYDRERHRLCSTWSRPDRPEETLYRAAIRLYGLEELLAMFERAGLVVDATCGDYQGTPFEGHERMLIVLAHKPTEFARS
jgi:SAM-dependent methyltransferase